MSSEIGTAQQRKAPLIFLVGGVIFVLASLQIGRTLPPIDGRLLIPTLVGIGTLMILIASLSLASKAMTFHFDALLQRPSAWFGISPWRFALVITGLLFSILAHYAAGELTLMNSPMIAWAAWLLSIGLVAGGAWQHNGLGLASRRTILWTAAGLSVLAYLVRGFTPEYYPIIFSGNEGSSGLIGLDILAGKFNNPFVMGWFSFPSLYFFIPAGSIAIFGHTLSALRIPSILAGSLTVGLTYITGRAMYGKQVGLLGALLLAGYQVHIQFSRIGLSNAWDGLFFVTVVGAVWYAWERENRNAFLIAGLGLGLSQYFYVTSHVLLILIPAWLFIVSIFNRARFKKLLPDITLMVLTALVVVLPLAWFYVHNPLEFLAPLHRVNAFGPAVDSVLQNDGPHLLRTAFEKILLGIQSFTYLPIWSWWYQSGTPLLGVPEAEFFLAGLAFLVFKIRESRNGLLLMWLAAFVFVGGFSDAPPSPQRFVAAMSALMIAAAYGLTQLSALVERVWPKVSLYARALLLLLVLSLSAKNVVYYYTEYIQLERYYLSETDGMIAQRLGKFLQTQPEDTQVVYFGYPRMGYYSIPSTQFLVPKITGLDMLGPWGTAANPQPDSEHLVFVFLPENEKEITQVQAAYPGGSLFEERSHWNRILYYYYVYEK